MFTLPELGYDYDSLAPHISRDIMELHHDKHHRTYVEKLNAAIEKHPEFNSNNLETLLENIDSLPEDIRSAVRNNGGGHYNHSLFWQWMSPQGGGEPTGALAGALNEKYGSFNAFKEAFNEAATGLFGSGWVWLEADLSISTSANQDSPVMEGRPAPLLGLDVWEHAYYLDYENKRDEYVHAWWNVVNWPFVSGRFGR